MTDVTSEPFSGPRRCNPFVPDSVARFLINVVRKTRELPGVLLGASPRSAIHLLTAAKAKARLSGRDHVTVDDVAAMARSSWRIGSSGTRPILRMWSGRLEATLPAAVTPG